jgi:hypothetical protein
MFEVDRVGGVVVEGRCAVPASMIAMINEDPDGGTMVILREGSEVHIPLEFDVVMLHMRQSLRVG